jgi:EmrB/QacA subfamily drug resistance transporter
VNHRHPLLSWGGPPQSTNKIPREYRWWALGVVMVVMFTASLTSTIVATAVPTIAADLHGFDLYGWVFSGYMLASTVSVPLFGQLSDVYGRRPLYLVGIAFFVLGSILGGLAPTMVWLIGARVVAGIGGGAMMALSTATIGDIFSPRERGRWMGLVMSVFGLASIIGPTLGGAVTDHLGWRWVLLLPVPVAVVAWLVAGTVMPRVTTGRERRVDPLGSALMVSGLVSLLLGFTWGGTAYAWGSAQEVSLFAIAGALLASFVWYEQRAPEPLLPPSFFRERVFTLSVVISFLVVGSMYGALSFIPLFVQGVIGKTAQNSGLVLSPMMLSFVVGSVVAGQIVSRTGRYKVQAVVGMALMVTGFFLFTRLSTASTSLEVVRDMVVLGIGIGVAMPIFSVTVQSVFPHSMLGTVNSARQLFSNLGGAIAVPVMTAVVVNTFHRDLVSNLPAAARPLAAGKNVQPESLLTAEAQRSVQHHFANDPAVYQRFVHGIRSALSSGIVDVFTIGLGLASLALLLATFMPRIELAHWEAPRESIAEPTPESGESESAASLALAASAQRD